MPSYRIEVRHDGLNKYRVITGNDPTAVQLKAEMQRRAWDEMWEKRLTQEKKRAVQEEIERSVGERNRGVQEALAAIDRILERGLQSSGPLDWEALKEKAPFSKPKPHPLKSKRSPREPQATDPEFAPKLGFWDKLSASRRAKRISNARLLFELSHAGWERDRKAQETFMEAMARWEDEHNIYLREQSEQNRVIDEQKAAYEKREPGAIVRYCELVLSQSDYPESVPKESALDYNPENGLLLVDYALPAPQAIPRTKEVRFAKSKNEFVEAQVSDAEANRRYDSALYQICLRTLHELFEADSLDALKQIVFNGWVKSIDPATGKQVNACILSVQVSRTAFRAVDLTKVDPKACFKALRGVGSPKLHSLTPIPPILTMDRNDRRFVSSYDVADRLDEGSNLAAMDWEDFEHLIRELFEQEFAAGGGEVKVTQASRDGGIDAVVFDPDPIRGGKIVIQAKRYTNVVGVSAVRDLYGTVINEGANKGILVTTADFGSDAYEFTKGKPLTLLNGANLLALLEKHGHRARIDLREARQVLAQTE